MQFNANAEVLTSNDEKVGRIDRVVFDPKSNEMTHLVVQKGFLFVKDKVVPLDCVKSATEERVELKEGCEDPDGFPDFEETHYVAVEDTTSSEKGGSGGLKALVWYYPLPGGAWWRARNFAYPGIPKPPYVRKTEINIPDGTVPLEEGARVVSREGEHVGDVDEEEQRVTHLLIAKGLISKSRKLIPSMWVDSVREDEVRLSVDEHFVENLP
jgi:uncharacterized protein YrrD